MSLNIYIIFSVVAIIVVSLVLLNNCSKNCYIGIIPISIILGILINSIPVAVLINQKNELQKEAVRLGFARYSYERISKANKFEFCHPSEFKCKKCNQENGE